jgi:hypothetical protein
MDIIPQIPKGVVKEPDTKTACKHKFEVIGGQPGCWDVKCKKCGKEDIDCS